MPSFPGALLLFMLLRDCLTSSTVKSRSSLVLTGCSVRVRTDLWWSLSVRLSSFGAKESIIRLRVSVVSAVWVPSSLSSVVICALVVPLPDASLYTTPQGLVAVETLSEFLP